MRNLSAVMLNVYQMRHHGLTILDETWSHNCNLVIRANYRDVLFNDCCSKKPILAQKLSREVEVNSTACKGLPGDKFRAW